MTTQEDPKDREKKPYHAPRLTTYGDITELTQTAVGPNKLDGQGPWGTSRYSN